LVTALRIVCGGSVVSTRSILAQDESEFPFVRSSSAMMTAFNSADNGRPTHLMSDALDVFLAAYSALGLPNVQADRSLQVAEARNAEVHGDDQPYAPLYLLSGAATDSLPKMLDDAERVMRRAVLVVLEEHARFKLP
jgi:hypothetical protein